MLDVQFSTKLRPELHELRSPLAANRRRGGAGPRMGAGDHGKRDRAWARPAPAVPGRQQHQGPLGPACCTSTTSYPFEVAAVVLLVRRSSAAIALTQIRHAQGKRSTRIRARQVEGAFGEDRVRLRPAWPSEKEGKADHSGGARRPACAFATVFKGVNVAGRIFSAPDAGALSWCWGANHVRDYRIAGIFLKPAANVIIVADGDRADAAGRPTSNFHSRSRATPRRHVRARCSSSFNPDGSRRAESAHRPLAILVLLFRNVGPPSTSRISATLKGPDAAP